MKYVIRHSSIRVKVFLACLRKGKETPFLSFRRQTPDLYEGKPRKMDGVLYVPHVLQEEVNRPSVKMKLVHQTEDQRNTISSYETTLTALLRKDNANILNSLLYLTFKLLFLQRKQSLEMLLKLILYFIAKEIREIHCLGL